MIQVQELIDLVIDFLHDSLADLKRCSLVSRSWLSTSQYHLFSYCSLESESGCLRLVAMLEESPHLLKLITHLAVAIRSEFYPDPKAYGALSNIHFTHLKQLTIYTLPSTTALPLLQSLVALSSVSHISVMQTRDPSVLLSLFLLRTANLRTLEIGPRQYSGEHLYGPDRFQVPSIRTSHQRFQVECLQISNARGEFVEKLADPSSSPINMGALQRIAATSDWAQSFRTMLPKFGSSLSHLELSGPIGGRPETFGKELDISTTVLPRLTHFTYHIFSPSALPVIPALLTNFSSGATLQRLTLIVSRDCAPSSTDLSRFEHVEFWKAIDDAVAALSSVSLTVVVSLRAAGVLESVYEW
ncbi:hypothetical protein C8R44DRAFT_870975 [Mycena epipterygia]|nr:hypothetical protein C8R44DRAFT_870975 [Mycena epipterygia]